MPKKSQINEYSDVGGVGHIYDTKARLICSYLHSWSWWNWDGTKELCFAPTLWKQKYRLVQDVL